MKEDALNQGPQGWGQPGQYRQGSAPQGWPGRPPAPGPKASPALIAGLVGGGVVVLVALVLLLRSAALAQQATCDAAIQEATTKVHDALARDDEQSALKEIIAARHVCKEGSAERIAALDAQVERHVEAKNAAAAKAALAAAPTSQAESTAVASAFVDPNTLVVGRSYVLTRKTPLMPDPDPADSVGAIALMKQVPPGTRFSVKGKRTVNGSLWYQVQPVGFGAGWFKVGALYGQNLEPR